MTLPFDPAELSDSEKTALIRELWDQNARLRKEVERLRSRLAELEERLGRPPKTPRNSSAPPSQGQKANRPAKKGRKKRERGPGSARRLHPNPDRTVEARADTCPGCGGHVEDAQQTLKAVYDRIEIPPVRPDVTRVRQYKGRCPCCGESFDAVAPAGLVPGSPFGPSVQALVIYLHSMHVWIGLRV